MLDGLRTKLAKTFSMLGDRRGRIVAAIAIILVVGGIGLISLLTTSRPGAPEASVGEPAGSPSPSPVAAAVLSRSIPVSLDIPSIGVHSVIQRSGLNAEGGLEVPAPGAHYNEAAWYQGSPTPGSLGPAILLGHIDSAAEGPSVFYRLGEMQPGDLVSVTRADDSVAVFIVDEVNRYPKVDFPTHLVYGNIDHAGLRMVSCGGAFDQSTGHYVDNIVVFASLTQQ
jgi:hypothetical protein